MTTFAQSIQPYVENEINLSGQCRQSGNFPDEFRHLESAHVLGQASTFHHIHVHWLMFKWGLRQKDLRECSGQVLRMLGALTKTAIGLVPSGNTGGSNISPFRSLPIKPELQEMIDKAKLTRNE